MSSVSDVQAQSSFTRVEQKFEDKGDPILDYLQGAAVAAVAAISAQTVIDDSEFPTASATSPLVGTGGTNVLHDALRETIESGNYIDPQDEERLFERMREREERQVLVAQDEALRMFAAGGFTKPPGALSAAVARIQAEGRDRVASANREMAIAKQNLLLDAKVKFFDIATKLDQTVVDNVVKILQARLDQVKAHLQAQAAIATAAMSGLNVNIGMSVSGSAGVSGSESVSEQYDKTAGVLRKSQTESHTVSESEQVIEQHNYMET